MRTTARLGIAVLALALGATPARAEGSDGLGACVLVAAGNTTDVLVDPAQYAGALVAVGVGYAPTIGHNPVVVDLTCTLYAGDDWEPLASTTNLFATQAVAARVGPVQYEDIGEVLRVCTQLTLLNSQGQYDMLGGCEVVERTSVLPQDVRDVLAPVCALPEGYRACDVLAANQVRVTSALVEI